MALGDKAAEKGFQRSGGEGGILNAADSKGMHGSGRGHLE